MESYRQDIESESAKEIEEDSSERDPINFWEQKQRELVTSVVDYNLSTLSELITTEIIDLSPRYQRRLRWDRDRQSKLIESFLMNVPVPPIYLNEDKYGEYSVIDGKQRLLAVNEFLRGRLVLQNLSVFPDVEGMSIDSLPTSLQAVLKTRPTLRAIVILRQSDEDIKFEVFQRLNTGGVRLNPQEIRNSAYPGPLNDLILELSEHEKFHTLLGVKNKNKSKIYKEMRDAEFVLRFFTFRATWPTFSGGMKRHMDQFMANNQHITGAQLGELKEDFLSSLDVVECCFGNEAFKRWLPDKEQWKNQVLAALFDAEMFACREFPKEEVASKSDEIREGFKKLFLRDDFRKSVDAATNTPSYFRSRIEILRELIYSTLRD